MKKIAKIYFTPLSSLSLDHSTLFLSPSLSFSSSPSLTNPASLFTKIDSLPAWTVVHVQRFKSIPFRNKTLPYYTSYQLATVVSGFLWYKS